MPTLFRNKEDKSVHRLTDPHAGRPGDLLLRVHRSDYKVTIPKESTWICPYFLHVAFSPFSEESHVWVTEHLECRPGESEESNAYLCEGGQVGPVKGGVGYYPGSLKQYTLVCVSCMSIVPPTHTHTMKSHSFAAFLHRKASNMPWCLHVCESGIRDVGKALIAIGQAIEGEDHPLTTFTFEPAMQLEFTDVCWLQVCITMRVLLSCASAEGSIVDGTAALHSLLHAVTSLRHSLSKNQLIALLGANGTGEGGGSPLLPCGDGRGQTSMAALAHMQVSERPRNTTRTYK